MSKHISRKSKWIEVSPIRQESAFGYIKKNSDGLWDAFAIYSTRPQLNDIVRSRPWTKREEILGEYKRAREAMDAVENKIKELKRASNEDILL